MNKKVIIGVIVAIAAIGLITINILKNTGASTVFGGGNAYPVKVEKIQKGEISSYITANGVIEEVEKGEVYLDTPLKVTKLLVAEGQKVNKGQKILDLDTSSLTSELEKLKVNKSIQELSRNSKMVNSEVERAQSALKSAERNFNDSRKTYLDNKELYASNAISKNELEMSEKAYNQAESTLSDARIVYSNALESRKVNVATADENLKITNLSISDLEKKITSVNEAAVSPINGVVAALNVQEGAYTSNMQPAYKIIKLDKLQIKANIKEFDIKNVAVGQEVRISGDAIDKNTEITGKVTAISPVAVVTRTASGEETVVEVTITIEDTKGLLKPGLNVTCDIYTVNKKDVILAPMELITEDVNGNKIVYVVDPATNKMKQTMIKLGINSDMSVEVVNGLKEGDLVIIDPQPMFKDGAKVRIQEQIKE